MKRRILMKIMSAVLAGAVILSQPAAVYAAADTQDYAEAVIEEDAGSFASEGGEDTGSSADHYEETPDEGTASFSQGDQNIYDGYDSSYVDAAAAQAAEVSGSGDLTDEEKELLGISDETAYAVAEEQVEAQMVQAAETAVTGFTVTDSAGNTVREYVRDGIHYIFATNCTDLSNMTVSSATVFTSVPDGFAISEDGTSMTGAFSPGGNCNGRYRSGRIPSVCHAVDGAESFHFPERDDTRRDPEG